MPVKEADPSAISLDAAFAAAMDTPGAPREPGPPPEVDNDAPHGRAEDGTPLAPYGLTKDGKPKKTAAGRKPADADKARITDSPPPPEQAPGKGGELAPRRYAPAIADVLETAWLGGTMIGMVGPDLPLVGRFVPGPQVQAQAAMILLYKDSVAGALDLAAQHNARARRLAERCASGDVGWALNVAFMLLPVASVSLQVWGKQEQEYHPETGEPLPTFVDHLVKQNADAFRAYIDKLAEQAQLAAEAAAA